MMSASAEASTVSLWSLWQSNRADLAPFGTCCALARAGKLPGVLSVPNGTPRIRADHIEPALAAMHKDAH